MAGFEIRELSGEEELLLVERYMPYPPDPLKFQRYFYQQMLGWGKLLIAWKGNIPVGHIFIYFEPNFCRLGESCPELTDLHVDPGHRRQGIATELLYSVESQVRQNNRNKIGLEVGTDNDDAISLYVKNSYIRNPGKPEFGYYELDENGEFEQKTRICYYYTKDLN